MVYNGWNGLKNDNGWRKFLGKEEGTAASRGRALRDPYEKTINGL